MIRLVLSDMDNTLMPFGEDRVIERTIRSIHALKEAGVEFAPASGRGIWEMESFFAHDTACYQTAVLVNGQQVLCQGTTIFEKLLDAEALRRLDERVRGLPHCAFVTYRADGTGDWTGESAEDMGEAIFRSAFQRGAHHHERFVGYPTLKAGVNCSAGPEATRALQAELCTLCPEFDFPNTLGGWMDVIPHGWSKADGIRVLAEALDISLDEVCVFGDGSNDLTMFELVGASVAVANASPDAAAAARYHVGAATDDGVARALDQIGEAARACARTATDDIWPAFMEAQA